MITPKVSFQNKGTTVCLFLENPESYIIVILMKKRLHIIKLFGRPLNSSCLIKLFSREKLTLIEEDEIVESDINTVQILNSFFSNIISNLIIA